MTTTERITAVRRELVHRQRRQVCALRPAYGQQRGTSRGPGRSAPVPDLLSSAPATWLPPTLLAP